MTIVIALVAGLLFGTGLIVSGMANPAKMLDFLDSSGQRDPSLTFVMAGVIAIGVIVFLVACWRGRSWLGTSIQLLSATGVTAWLMLGNVVFGTGWELVGFCSGPALVAPDVGVLKAVGFITVMLADITVFSWL